jgi:hypothetical protein
VAEPSESCSEDGGNRDTLGLTEGPAGKEERVSYHYYSITLGEGRLLLLLYNIRRGEGQLPLLLYNIRRGSVTTTTLTLREERVSYYYSITLSEEKLLSVYKTISEQQYTQDEQLATVQRTADNTETLNL